MHSLSGVKARSILVNSHLRRHIVALQRGREKEVWRMQSFDVVLCDMCVLFSFTHLYIYMFFAYQYIFICIHVLYNLSIFLFICLLGSIPIVSESNPSAEFDCDVAGGSLHRLRCFVAFSCSWSCQSLRGSTPTRDHMVWHIIIFKIACILAKSNALCGQFMSVHVCSCSVAPSDPDPKLVLMRNLAASLHKIRGPHPPVLAQPSEVLQRGSWPGSWELLIGWQ